jgi:hypothetical protein
MAKKSGTYTRDEQSAEKVIWMLFLDSLEALIDCLNLSRDKKHRIAVRLFRDAVEAMDMASYFCSNDAKKVVIAMYYALIGDLISHFVTKMIDSRLISAEEAKVIWNESLEKEAVERRFISPKEVFERFLKEVDDIT